MVQGVDVVTEVEEHEGLAGKAGWLQGEGLWDGQGSASPENTARASSLD